MVRPFFLATLFLASIFLSLRLLRFARLIAGRGFGALDFVWLSAYLLPAFLELVIPLALYVAVASALMRLRLDGEIVGIYALGGRGRSLMKPLSVVTIGLALLTFPLSAFVRPWALRALQSYVVGRTMGQPTLAVEEKVFVTPAPGVVLYVDGLRSGGRELQGILLSDARSPAKKEVVLARTGFLTPDPNGEGLLLRLHDGFVHTVDRRSNRIETISFSQFDWRWIAGGPSARVSEPRPQEMGWNEIRSAALEDHGPDAPIKLLAFRLEMFRRVMSPFGCLVFFVASLFPLQLAIRPSYAIIGGILGLLVLAYYTSQTAAEVLTMQGILPPVVGATFPYLVLAVVLGAGFPVVRAWSRWSLA